MLPVALAAAAALCRIPLAESSGLAASSFDDGVAFSHEDSGSSARFVALDLSSCRVLATYRVGGAVNIDWEDMAVGRGSVWLADIGDNRRRRTSVTVYRVAEPRPPWRSATLASSAQRLRYADGPHDAETLLLDPRGGPMAVVTKDLLSSAFYTASGSVLTRNGPVPLLLPTGGAWSPDGRRVVVRTYTGAALWSVRGSLAATLRRAPADVTLPTQPQGESVAFSRDGTSLLVSSEHRGAPIWRVPLPAAASPTPRPVTAAPGAAGAGDRSKPTGSGRPALAVAGLGAVAVALLLSRRRQRRSVDGRRSG